MEATKKVILPKERELCWVRISNEQNRKGEVFSRPVTIIKGFSHNMFFGIPLSTKISNALIAQGRLFDTKRLENRLSMISKDDCENIKNNLKGLLDV